MPVLFALFEEGSKMFTPIQFESPAKGREKMAIQFIRTWSYPQIGYITIYLLCITKLYVSEDIINCENSRKTRSTLVLFFLSPLQRGVKNKGLTTRQWVYK